MSAETRGQIAAVAARKLAKVAGSRRGMRLREAPQVSRRHQTERRNAAAPFLNGDKLLKRQLSLWRFFFFFYIESFARCLC